MGAALKKQEEDFDAVFGGISRLYDHAENILKVAYDDSVTDKDAFFSEIETLVKQIEESTNSIAEDFSKTIESGKEPTSALKMRITVALRKALTVIEDYKKLVYTKYS